MILSILPVRALPQPAGRILMVCCELSPRLIFRYRLILLSSIGIQSVFFPEFCLMDLINVVAEFLAQVFGFSREVVPSLRTQFYKTNGSTLAGLRVGFSPPPYSICKKQ